MNLLPQVSSKDLNQRDFQRWDFTMHENASQIQLNLETYVDVRSIYSGRPPQRETSVWNLIQTTSLGVR